MRVKPAFVICVLLLSFQLQAASFSSSSKFSVRWVQYSRSTQEQFFPKRNEVFSYDYMYGLSWLKLGLGIGVLKEKSFLVGKDTGQKSGESLNLTAMPMEAYLELLPLQMTKWYIQPLISGGYQAHVLWVKETEQKLKTLKHGISLKAGLRFFMHDKTSLDAQEMFGIKNIFVDAFVSHRPTFSDGVDVSAWDFGTSVGVDF